MKTYVGILSGSQCSVSVDSRPLDPRLDLRNHSPTGFQWGYGGSGPTQLALAILADCMGVDTALKYYQDFKVSVIAPLPREGWSLTEEEVRKSVSLLETISGKE